MTRVRKEAFNYIKSKILLLAAIFAILLTISIILFLPLSSLHLVVISMLMIVVAIIIILSFCNLDIAEKKLIEMQYLKALMQNAPDMIIIRNEHLEIINVNKAFLEMSKYKKEDILGTNISLLQDPEKTTSGYSISYLTTKDNQIIPVELFVNETEINGCKYRIKVMRDISKRIKIEQDLKYSEEQYLLASEGSRVGIWHWNIQKDELFWSSRCRNIMGFGNKTIPHAELWWNIIHEDDVKNLKEKLNDHFDLGKEFCTDLRIKHQQKHIYIWARIRGQAIWDESHLPIKIAGSLEDITHEKILQDELEDHRKNLESKIQEQTRELTAAKEKAEAANNAKTEFLSNISHELRTPMHGIISFAELTINRIDEISKDKTISYIKNIKHSADRLIIFINDLLDLAKLESKKMEMDFQIYNIKEITNNCLVDLSQLISNKNINISNQITDCDVLCDNLRIHQVVMNLLSNAIKFSPNGGEIKLLSYQIFRNSSKFLEFNVEDEGVGIDDDEKEAIFDKFTQSSKTKSKSGGTGLGLAICKEIILAHNGSIWVESNEKNGSTFKFILPLGVKI